MRPNAPFLYMHLLGALMERGANPMPVWDFRKVAGQVLHIRKRDASVVLVEMDRMELVRYDPKSETVRILRR